MRRRKLAGGLLGAIVILAGASMVYRTVFTDARHRGGDPKPTSLIVPALTGGISRYAAGDIRRDVEYCNGQKLDIYYPKTVRYQFAPVVMYIHGGGWVLNDKSSETDLLAMLEPLRDDGFAVVSIDYRKVPDAYYPAPIDDALCAVRYVRATAATAGFDSDRIGLYGFSAGGYLAAMVGLLDTDNPYRGQQYAGYSSRVSAVVTLAGLFDYSQAVDSGNLQRFDRFLHGGDRQAAQPARYVTRDDPPFLLIHGLHDQFVSPSQDDVFIAKLQAAGVPFQVIRVADADHGLNPSGGQPVPNRVDVAGRIAVFMKEQLKPRP